MISYTEFLDIALSQKLINKYQKKRLLNKPHKNAFIDTITVYQANHGKGKRVFVLGKDEENLSALKAYISVYFRRYNRKKSK